MQMYAPKGYEATAFTLMQWSGTIGQVLGRNLEYWIMALLGVSLGNNLSGFWRVAVAGALWRVATAIFLMTFMSRGRMELVGKKEKPPQPTATADCKEVER